MPRTTIRTMVLKASRTIARRPGNHEEEGWLLHLFLSLPGEDGRLIASMAKMSGKGDGERMVVWMLYLLRDTAPDDCAMFIQRVRGWSEKTGNRKLLDPLDAFEKEQKTAAREKGRPRSGRKRKAAA